MIEDANDDDQQLQMALQMSLDEISIAKSRSLTKKEDDSETVLPTNDVQEESNSKTDIPVLLPK